MKWEKEKLKWGVALVSLNIINPRINIRRISVIIIDAWETMNDEVNIQSIYISENIIEMNWIISFGKIFNLIYSRSSFHPLFQNIYLKKM